MCTVHSAHNTLGILFCIIYSVWGWKYGDEAPLGNFCMHCKSIQQLSHKTCSLHPDLPKMRQQNNNNIIIRWRPQNPNGTLYLSWDCNTTKVQKRENFTHTVKKLYSISLITCHYISWVLSWNILVSWFTMRLFTPQVISTLVRRVFPHHVRDVLLKFGHIKEHLAVSPHLQTQVVAGGVYLMGLEATRREGNEEKNMLSSRN